jgi:hypothetical protein
MSAPEPDPPRYTGGQIAMTLFGVILLLPGLCSLLVMVMVPWNVNDPMFWMFVTVWIICLLVSVAGVATIDAGRRCAKKAN